MHCYKRNILLCLVFVCAVMCALMITASAEEIGYVNSSDGLNLRTGRGTDYTSLTVIGCGEKVTLYDCEDGWMKCSYNGQEGYVCAQYISFAAETGERVNIAPVTNTGNAISHEAAKYLSVPVTHTGNAIVDEAAKYLGVPYVYAGTSPSEGFDCSGLVYYVFTNLGYSMNRTAADQATQGEYVSKEELLPGDLVFFGTADYINHVGIYVGNGMMIHSPKPGYTVTYATIMSGYHCDNYVTARRLTAPENAQ